MHDCFIAGLPILVMSQQAVVEIVRDAKNKATVNLFGRVLVASSFDVVFNDFTLLPKALHCCLGFTMNRR